MPYNYKTGCFIFEPSCKLGQTIVSNSHGATKLTIGRMLYLSLVASIESCDVPYDDDYVVPEEKEWFSMIRWLNLFLDISLIRFFIFVNL